LFFPEKRLVDTDASFQHAYRGRLGFLVTKDCMDFMEFLVMLIRVKFGTRKVKEL
jgi:hypothetical protein